MAKKIKELTRAEEQVMQILWDMEKGFVKEVIALIPNPKPAYSTVSTIMRILVQKGFVGYKAYGKTYEYFPLISREEYRDFKTDKLLNGYYNDSMESLVSFFIEKKNPDIKEVNEIIRLLQKFKKHQK